MIKFSEWGKIMETDSLHYLYLQDSVFFSPWGMVGVMGLFACYMYRMILFFIKISNHHRD